MVTSGESEDVEEAPGQIKLHDRAQSPWWQLARRFLLALSVLAVTVILVYLECQEVPVRMVLQV